MDGLVLVLTLAALPAAGIVLAVVGLELMPEALTASTPGVPVLAFVGGGCSLHRHRTRHRLHQGPTRRR